MVLYTLLCLQIVSRWKKDKSSQISLETMPSVIGLTKDGTRFSTESIDGEPILVMLFDPECDHCGYETGAIISNLNRLGNASVLLVSAADCGKVERFAGERGLDTIPGITVLTCQREIFEKTFGNPPLPSTFIYGGDKKLQARFSGEVGIQAILNAMHADAAGTDPNSW